MEKIYLEVRNGKNTYWMVSDDNKNLVYQISSSTGKILRVESKKKL